MAAESYFSRDMQLSRSVLIQKAVWMKEKRTNLTWRVGDENYGNDSYGIGRKERGRRKN